MTKLSRHFSFSELACRCANPDCDGKDKIYLAQLAKHLEDLRAAAGFALPVNSAARCLDHPVERKKGPNSIHAHHRLFGVDLRVNRSQAYDVIAVASLLGWFGLGVAAKGADVGRFVHLDRREDRTVWSY